MAGKAVKNNAAEQASELIMLANAAEWNTFERENGFRYGEDAIEWLMAHFPAGEEVLSERDRLWLADLADRCYGGLIAGASATV